MTSRVLLVGFIVLIKSGFGLTAEAVTAASEPAIAFVVPKDEQTLRAVAPDLARQAIKMLTPAARDQDLMSTYQLEMVAGDDSAAEDTLASLRQRYQTVGASLARLVYPEMMTAAAKQQAESGGSFESTAASAVQRIYGSLTDEAYMDAEYWSVGSGAQAKQQLEADLAAVQGRTPSRFNRRLPWSATPCNIVSTTSCNHSSNDSSRRRTRGDSSLRTAY